MSKNSSGRLVSLSTFYYYETLGALILTKHNAVRCIVCCLSLSYTKVFNIIAPKCLFKAGLSQQCTNWEILSMYN